MSAAPAGPSRPGPAGALVFHGPDVAGNPAAFCARARSLGPVAPILLEGDVPAWFVTGYREVHRVLGRPAWFTRDPRVWNRRGRADRDRPPTPHPLWTQPPAEEPERRRRAEALGDALAATCWSDLRSLSLRVADRLIDTLAPRGRADLATQYAHLVPAGVFVRLYGLPEGHAGPLVREAAQVMDGSKDAAAAHRRIRSLVATLVADRRKRPRHDVPSRLLAHPYGLTDPEAIADLTSVLATAPTATGDWISGTLRLLLADRSRAADLAAGRSTVSQVLDEVLWHHTPVQNLLGRFAVQDCELGGRRIGRGDLLVLGLAAANTDPLLAPEAGRPHTSRAHVSFGRTGHGCPPPAPAMAGTVAAAAVEALMDRLPDLRPAGELRWRPSPWTRGPGSLPVHFTPVRGVPVVIAPPRT